ncbi:DUF1116 domain-containing protein [Salinisphaera sp. SPP-AMP-43]|uniref:oxamate carbamoyltransferase subunit AllG family protein n=1 Tax=Salinisphaera sp. SPP-AMP-43 TaxID=3121288 RepID=UPI003C6E25F6
MSGPASRSIDAQAAVFAMPRLRGVTRRRDIRPQLGERCLLHAGPPLSSDILPQALRNAAVQALIFEGMSAEQAALAVDRREIELCPAQDHGVVTPLAQVVSASMPLFVVGDDRHQAYAPIAEGAPPALRFGARDPACVQNLKWHSHWAFAELRPKLAAAPLAIAALVARALAEGDDCHARTGGANAALREALAPLSPGYDEAIAANANFVLPVLMAASAWVLAETRHSIAAVGGNGQRFGLRLAGQSQWRTCLAEPPVGVRLPDQEASPVLGAVGDSPVIDFCGLGGQSLAWAPELVSLWAGQLPSDWGDRAAAVTDPATGLVCRHRVAASGQVPLVHLAMVGGGPAGGLVGRGFYAPDLGIFLADHEPQAG